MGRSSAGQWPFRNGPFAVGGANAALFAGLYVLRGTMRICLLALVSGCVATPYIGPDGGNETDGGPQPDSGGCFGNNDGIIRKDELQLAVGLSVDYLVQSGSQTAPLTVDTAGSQQG